VRTPRLSQAVDGPLDVDLYEAPRRVERPTDLGPHTGQRPRERAHGVRKRRLQRARPDDGRQARRPTVR